MTPLSDAVAIGCIRMESETSVACDGALLHLQPASPLLCAVQADGELLIDCAGKSDDECSRGQAAAQTATECKFEQCCTAVHGQATEASTASHFREPSLAEARLRDIEERNALASTSSFPGVREPDTACANVETVTQTRAEKRIHQTELYTLNDVKLHPFPAVVLYERAKQIRRARSNGSTGQGESDKENQAHAVDILLPPLSTTATRIMSCSPPTSLYHEGAQKTHALSSSLTNRSRQALHSANLAYDVMTTRSA